MYDEEEIYNDLVASEGAKVKHIIRFISALLAGIGISIILISLAVFLIF